MTWQTSTINPATTSPAADITKITNDLGILRSVLSGSGSDSDVPFRLSNVYQDGSGNIGIGTATPDAKLHIYNASAITAKLTSSGGAATLLMGNQDSGGTNRPSSFLAANGVFTWGYGSSWAGSGGTITAQMTLDGSGNLGIGTTSPAYAIDVQRASANPTIAVRSGSSYDPILLLEASGLDSASLAYSRANSAFTILTGNSEGFRLTTAGAMFFPRVGTTASAANAFLNSASTPANQLLRSTSSLRYKKDVRDLPDSYADALMQLRPVVYKSKAEADDQSLDWVGLIAEEVASIAPRLVQYTTLGEGGESVPDGVQYDRLAVVMLHVLKQLKADNDNLKARVTALESR